MQELATHTENTRY